MKISTKARYGTRALLDLALHQGDGPVALKDIARRQEIPRYYLEQLISPLITAGIVRSTRGPKGGVSLVREPGKIHLSEVIQALEGSTAPVDCVDDPKVCSRCDICVTRDVWDEVKKAMDEVLESTTLEELAERHRRKQATDVTMYHI